MASGLEIEDETENKGSMWVLEQKLDQPMDEEAGRLRNMYREKKFSALLLLRLAFQSLGVVYGDLGTSPLYVFYNTFPHGVRDPEDVIGALSLIIYSLTLIPLLKYVFIVCKANDNGQGGTFALYSLLCRHAKINTIPNQHRTDEELTTYSRNTFHEHSYAAKTKRWLEKYASRKHALLVLVLVATCMVIGDGILTPAISDIVVLVAVVILIFLFILQHYGTDKVGWLFAPIVLLWFILIGEGEEEMLGPPSEGSCLVSQFRCHLPIAIINSLQISAEDYPDTDEPRRPSVDHSDYHPVLVDYSQTPTSLVGPPWIIPTPYKSDPDLR
ncbi:hypothetical protein RHGRI_036969 [Rhododendron griersonianum]|uniref:K+ potassium transporter integral membrane domain-containing protein n=1 Tax=Rhododendron griersonianum TaxID=479676 RepID=A0AAV6HTT4_9ERIC|nr:hypothetical protein RHGRI_036969 [Rhododendron griersonianum]